MTARVVGSKMKGFVALDAHPTGCCVNVERAIADAERHAQPRDAPGVVLVLGASTCYGLASTLTAAFGHRLSTIGVCLERPAERGRTATAGWYNAATAAALARERGLELRFVNADGFAHATKARVLELLRERGARVGVLINSVAAPVRVDPDTGERYRSSLKPVGGPYRTKTIRLDSGEVTNVELEAASGEEIEQTRRVMGGDDWALWIDALADADLIASDFRTVAFSYVGPELTFPIYRSGTIGQAKQHLEHTAVELDARLGTNGWAAASVNGAAITQSSTAIPAVPLYISLLLAAAADLDVHVQTPAEQVERLFADYLLAPTPGVTDDTQRIRLDDWEMLPHTAGRDRPPLGQRRRRQPRSARELRSVQAWVPPALRLRHRRRRLQHSGRDRHPNRRLTAGVLSGGISVRREHDAPPGPRSPAYPAIQDAAQRDAWPRFSDGASTTVGGLVGGPITRVAGGRGRGASR